MQNDRFQILTKRNRRNTVNQCHFLLHYLALPHYHYRFLHAYLGDRYQSIAAHSLYRHMLDWHKHKYNCKIRTPVQRQEQVDRSSNLLVASLHLVSSHDLLALGFCDLFSNTFARYMLDSLHVLCAFPNSDDMETNWSDSTLPFFTQNKWYLS